MIYTDFKAWSELVQHYVQAIRNGAVPCIGNAVTTMSKVENTNSLNAALQMYKDAMDGVKLPTEDQQTLDESSLAEEKRALDFFKEHSIFDTKETFLNQLLVSKLI